MKLPGKKILLGITGSIAAYKAAELVRLLVKEGAEVQVIMSRSAHDFITPLTLGTLSGKPVLTEFSEPSSGTWNNHVELGLWADAMLIAPLSANTLSKMAHGTCDNLLSAVYLSARCPVFIAPAMDLDMFAHASTAGNISTVMSFGVQVIGPESGELASGLEGKGRLTEPSDICEYLIQVLNPSPDLSGKKILISAGPTREAIDPVRFISNHSSGKMGVALAEACTIRGAEVHLVCGPGVQVPLMKNLKVYHVISAEDMYLQCINLFASADIAIMAAAVADYTPAVTSDTKIKKSGSDMRIELKPTKDVLKEMGSVKKDNQLLVGFALETNDEINNAKKKLSTKNLDYIVLNSLNDKGAGFNHNSNKITILDKSNRMFAFDLKSKKEVAVDIISTILS